MNIFHNIGYSSLYQVGDKADFAAVTECSDFLTTAFSERMQVMIACQSR